MTPPAQNWQADPSQSAASAAVGPEFGWSKDYDPQIKTGTKTVTTPGTRETIVAVRPGAIDLRDDQGNIHTITSWQGKPVTRDVLDSDGKVSTFPAYGLPITSIIDSKGHASQVFETSPGSTQTVPDHKAASDIMKEKSQEAQDADPAKRKDFTDTQDRLQRAGFLDPGTYIKGLPDDATMKALEHALVVSDRTGQSLDEVLDEGAQNPAKGPKEQTRNIQLTSPDTVKQAIIKDAPAILGRGVDPNMLANLAAGYNALEAQQQNSAYDAVDANTASGDQGVTNITYNPPSLSDYVEQQLRSSDPTAAQGMQMGHYLAEFASLLGSNSSGTPSTFAKVAG